MSVDPGKITHILLDDGAGWRPAWHFTIFPRGIVVEPEEFRSLPGFDSPLCLTGGFSSRRASASGRSSPASCPRSSRSSRSETRDTNP
jgi:hypothetical protein